MIRILVLLLSCLAAPGAAQDFPASYYVTGVAADDVLNIRAQAEAGADIIGEYGPYRLNIEVLATTPDGSWGRVGLGEGMGWVSMSFLSATLPPEPGTIPRPLVCSGTEPFWSLTMHPRGAEYATPDDGPRSLTMTRESVAENGYLATFAEGPRTDKSLIVHRLSCDDGMSDREFGFRAMLFNADNGANLVQIGCCTLDYAD